jgi:hypothetical protein
MESMADKRADAPKGVTIESLQDGVNVSFSPFSLVWVWVPFFVLMAVMLGYPGILTLQLAFTSGSSWELVFFTLLLLVFSLFMVYLALVWGFNRATVEIRQGKLTVTQGPFPYARPKVLETADVRQIYITKRESRFGSHQILRHGSPRNSSVGMKCRLPLQFSCFVLA